MNGGEALFEVKQATIAFYSCFTPVQSVLVCVFAAFGDENGLALLQSCKFPVSPQQTGHDFAIALH
jgi:hypothetical protein